MHKQAIAGHVQRIRVLLGKCGKAGKCFASVQKLSIAGQVCRSRTLACA